MFSQSSNSKQHSERHQTTAHKDGDWLIYSCQKCAYQFWDHQKTGELKILNSNPGVKHFGTHIMPEFLKALENSN